MEDFQMQTFGTTGPLVFFLHGWPDTSSIFSEQVEALSRDHRCVAVTNPLSGHPRSRVLGPSWPEMYRGFERLVEKIRQPEERISIVAHDWGTMMAVDYERKYGKQRVDRLVLLDVFPDARKDVKPSLALLVLVFIYQSWLIAALLIWRYVPVVGETVGNAMTTVCAFVFGAPGVRSRQRTISAAQNYYYLWFWVGLLWGGPYAVFGSHTKATGGVRLPEVPLLFVYGSRKPIQFHPADLGDYLRKKGDGSRCEGVPHSHWVTRSPSTTRLLIEFLK